MYDYLPDNIRKTVENPFVFISYSHENRTVFNRVQMLASYLREKGVPVVYDEGGLPPGIELTQFENLILNNNCTYVLVVCDKCYLKKIEKNEGGAWREYFNISNDYPKKKSKYIPLIYDEHIPIFSGKVYIDFSEYSGQTLSIIENSIGKLKKKNSKVKAEELAKDANRLCNKKSFQAAYKKIVEAIDIYGRQNRTSKSFWAYLYNLNIYICIKLEKASEAMTMAQKLSSVITDRLDCYKRAMYYGNCALAYRMGNTGSSKYEEYARKAFLVAKNGDDEELYYYACMYATALYETEQYSDAYRVMKEALEGFQDKHQDSTKYTKEDYIMLMKIKGNIAEIAVACGENNPENRMEKKEFLLEAKDNIMDILSNDEFVVDDKIYTEMYSIAVLVFESLRKYYSI